RGRRVGGHRHQLSAISFQPRYQGTQHAFHLLYIRQNGVVCVAGDEPKISSQHEILESLAEPIATCRKRAKSASDDRPQPSAILAAIDVAARRIWLKAVSFGCRKALG